MLLPPGDMLFHHGSVLEHGHDIKEGHDGRGQLVLLHVVDNTLVPQFFLDHSHNRVPKIGLQIVDDLEDVPLAVTTPYM